MHQKRFYHSFIIVVYVVTIGIALSAILAWRSAHWIEETEREQFNDASQQIVLLIKSALQKDVQLLQSLAAFLMSSSDVDRAEWKLFLSRHPQKDLPGVELFAYAPRIKTDQKENFEALMQNNGYSTYRVFPEVKQPYCCPMTYIEPLTPTNEKALGFDIASEEVRRLALETAIKTGNPTISSKIALVMEKTHEKDGYVIYVPVYDALMPLTTETERALASKGVVIAALQVKEFFAGLLGMRYIGVDFELYEGTSITLSNKV